jgi:phage baseplate assembly protein W
MTMDSEKMILGTDLKLGETYIGSDLSNSAQGDLEQLSEEMNLAQAILHRLRTIRGELEDIGHADYGSNLYDLIGEPNNQTTRDRLKAIVRSTVMEEPRIKEIVKIEVKSRLAILDQKQGVWDPAAWAKVAKVELQRVKDGTDEISIPGGSYIEDRRSLATSVDIDITIVPIDSNVPLNIVFPFYLEVT